MDGLASGVGLSRLEEAEYLVAPSEDPAVCLELGVICEGTDPGGGLAAVDVSVIADDQGPAVAHSVASIGRRHHDDRLSLEPRSA